MKAVENRVITNNGDASDRDFLPGDAHDDRRGGGVVSKVVNRQRFVGKETKSNTTQNICRVEEKPLRVFKREHAHEGKNMPFSQQVYMP